MERLPPDSYFLPLDPYSLAMGVAGLIITFLALVGMAWIGWYRSVKVGPLE